MNHERDAKFYYQKLKEPIIVPDNRLFYVYEKLMKLWFWDWGKHVDSPLNFYSHPNYSIKLPYRFLCV